MAWSIIFFSFLVVILAKQPSRYSLSSGFHPWDVGLDNLNGHVAAFGDFNSDKKTDVFVVEEDKSSISVFLWHSKSYRFERSITLKTSLAVSNVIPSDFNHDGCLDLLVLGKQQQDQEMYDVHLYLGRIDSIDPQPAAKFQSLDQLLLFDFNGDLLADLIGSDIQGNPSIWLNQATEDVMKFEQQSFSELNRTFVSPIGNSFVDIDGDCRADLITISKSVNGNARMDAYISTGNSDALWAPSNGLSDLLISKDSSQVIWADFDGDGNADALYVDGYNLHVLYNQQKTMCGTSQSRGSCRSSDSLCSSDDNFIFSADPELGGIVKLDLGDFRLVSGSDIGLDFEGIESPPIVRVGDVNLDGYPDLLLAVTNAKGKSFTVIYQNVKCSESTCEISALSNERRTFKRFTGSNVEQIEHVENVFAAAFLDLDEKGANDVLILSYDKKTGFRSMQVFINFLNEDAYFFKTMGLNGVCPEWCQGTTFPNPKPYGSNQPGVTSKFTVTDIDGHPLIRQVSQLQQSQFLSLQLPYNLLGLGRTNNYIEEYFIGFPISNNGESKCYASWQSMIPNSQVIVFPYKRNKPSMWLLELLISPSDSLKWVVVALCSVIAFLALVIAYLHWRERVHDVAEKKKFDTHFYAF